MTTRGVKGYLCFVLHAHMPYVRHPEHPYFLEELWLYEALTESYIPLLDLFSRLIDDRVDFRVTLSVSPSLADMLNDDLLMRRYSAHLERLIELTKDELRRNRRDPSFYPIVRMYCAKFRRVQYLFEKVYRRNLMEVFRRMHEVHRLEMITSAGTHAYLPLLSDYPEAVRAQLRVGLRQYRADFGRNPNGMWLPECGFAFGFDRYLSEEGYAFFFLETHGIMRGEPLPRYGTYVPAVCRTGVWAFARDADVSRQVWSSIAGYPGDPDYREFYRDVGFDTDVDHVRAFLDPYGARTYTGLKYYRITGKTTVKCPYDILRALRKARLHADHFVSCREKQIRDLSAKFRIRPVITATYDAELFGHWWFEGVDWLENICRSISSGAGVFRMVTPSEYLDLPRRLRAAQFCQPSASSWGEYGYHDVWLNERNDYLYRHLLKATERMIDLAQRFPTAEGIFKRALDQAAREVLLAQQSDWSFMIRNDRCADYARNRFATHIARFAALREGILSGNVDERNLKAMEEADRIFPWLDYRVFRGREDSETSALVRHTRRFS